VLTCCGCRPGRRCKAPFLDLSRRSSGVGPRAGTCGTYFPLFFKILGVNTTVRNGQASDMAANLQDGLIDAFPFCAGIPIAAYSELETTNKVRFFTISDDELKKLKAALPELSDSLIPKGTYKQLTADHRTVGVFNCAIAHKDLPDDLVYAVVKAVLENNPQWRKGTPRRERPCLPTGTAIRFCRSTRAQYATCGRKASTCRNISCRPRTKG
jgi:TRAP-type uncharacterized transport system substrate-binding protein